MESTGKFRAFACTFSVDAGFRGAFMMAYGKSVDHGLEAEVHFSGADNFGDILYYLSIASMYT